MSTQVLLEPLFRTGHGRSAGLQLLAVRIRKPRSAEDAPLPCQCAKSDLLYLDTLLVKSCPCNRCGTCTARFHPCLFCPMRHWHPQSISFDSNAMRSMDKQSLRQHGPPKQAASLPLPKPSEARGAQQSTLDHLPLPAEPDLGGLAPQATAIIVESSEVSPHCFLVCVSCGLERSLLLPMPADDFQAALGSFASSHRACQL